MPEEPKPSEKEVKEPKVKDEYLTEQELKPTTAEELEPLVELEVVIELEVVTKNFRMIEEPKTLKGSAISRAYSLNLSCPHWLTTIRACHREAYHALPKVKIKCFNH